MEYNFYKIYGLTIKSSIPLHDSIKINNPNFYDVKIDYGKVYSENNIDTCSIGIFNFSPDNITFKIRDVASYKISNGNTITVDTEGNSCFDEIKKYVLGSSLGMLLLQKNIVAIHGGAVVIDDNAIIISGNIGAGKTTTIANLLNKGYGFLSDDVSAIMKNNNNTYSVQPCVPQQRLCKNTVHILGHNIYDLVQVDKLKDKYLSPQVNNFVRSEKKLKAIFYLDTTDASKVTYEEILGAEKFKLIMSNIFRKEFIPNKFIKPPYIKDCLAIAMSTPIYKISRPKNKDSVNEIILIIEKLTKGDFKND